jgi:hypothetical protein
MSASHPHREETTVSKERRTDHATFTIPLPGVFRAFEDPGSDRRWFVDGEGWEILGWAYDLLWRAGHL